MAFTAPAKLIIAPAQLITAPAQPPATGAAVYTALFIEQKNLLWCMKAYVMMLYRILDSLSFDLNNSLIFEQKDHANTAPQSR